jgi:hypothetical protein
MLPDNYQIPSKITALLLQKAPQQRHITSCIKRKVTEWMLSQASFIGFVWKYLLGKLSK